MLNIKLEAQVYYYSSFCFKFIF